MKWKSVITVTFNITIDHRQSYRHADPRRQRQQAGQESAAPAIVTSNRVVCNHVTFDLWVNACRATAIVYICTKFGVDSSSRFPFRAWTDRQMRLNALPTPTRAFGPRPTPPTIALYALLSLLLSL